MSQAASSAPRRAHRSLVVLLLGLSSALAGSGWTAGGGAQAAGPDVLDSPGCEAGAFVFLSADPAAVRAAGRIPARWKLQLDSAGRSRLYVDTATCQETLNGRTRTVVWTQLAAQLDSAQLPSPERSRSTSDVEGKPFDFYLLAWDANDRDLVRWLRAGTGLGDVARYVPGLTFRLTGEGLRDYEFNAPRPIPSPFTISATYTPNLVPVYPIESNFWRQTSVGSVLLDQSHDLPYLFGFFQQWAFTTVPGSPNGRMIGGGHQVRTCTPDLAPAPLIGQNGQDPGCLGVNAPDGHWTEKKTL